MPLRFIRLRGIARARRTAAGWNKRPSKRARGLPRSRPSKRMRGNGAPRGATLLSSRFGSTVASGETATRTALRRSKQRCRSARRTGRNLQRANIAASSNIRCGVSGLRIPRKIGAGTGEGVALRGPRNESARSSTHSFRRLSPPLVRSASRRKRHLPVVGEGGSTSASRGACASRARRRRASFHFANASRSAPHE